MRTPKALGLAMALCVLLPAVSAASTAASTSPVAVKWQMIENQKGHYLSAFTITNTSDATLDAGWAFYYNKMSTRVTSIDGQPLSVKAIINNNYCCLTPNAAYRPLAPGESVTAQILTSGAFRYICDRPDGGHIVLAGTGKAIPVHIEIAPLRDPKQFSIHNKANYPDGNYMWAENRLSCPEGVDYAGTAYDIFPTPKQVRLNKKGATVTVPESVRLVLPVFSEVSKGYITASLKACGITVDDKAKYTVRAIVDPVGTGDNKEGYTLSVGKKSVQIAGNSHEGVLNAFKTLTAVLARSGRTLPQADITDWPDFNYRGLMLDISRNFTTYDHLLDYIDRLAGYKINVFQFHFSDDEAWRLEIPGLPELTEIASRKGFTLNDYKSQWLMPTYTSTGRADDTGTPANGYITRPQFISLLKYAHERGVQVIPEVEMPGHARAAIVAMRHRYDRFTAAGDTAEANRYRCFDPADTARFESAQGYYDNVLNPALDGTYRLLHKIIDEIAIMYSEAGLKLEAVHLGGDEVPKGCWSGSPAIDALKKAHGYTSEHQVAEHFFTKIASWVSGRGFKVNGWQEVAAHHSDDYARSVAPMLGGVNVWSTMGKDERLPYALANLGVPVILSNVNTLYLDLQYRPHEYEYGLAWGGCVDEIISWETLPYNIYRSAQLDYYGKRVNLATAADGKPGLQAPQNIIGLQAQLWGETLRDYGMVQNLTFPKVFGLVERAWNARPSWGEGSLDKELYNAERAQYCLKIGLKELPYLHRTGARFHLAQPGATVQDGQLVANAPYPGVTIRYTLDGTEPDVQSPEWTVPVAVGNAMQAKLKAYYLNQQSVTTTLNIK